MSLNGPAASFPFKTSELFILFFFFCMYMSTVEYGFSILCKTNTICVHVQCSLDVKHLLENLFRRISFFSHRDRRNRTTTTTTITKMAIDENLYQTISGKNANNNSGETCVFNFEHSKNSERINNNETL